jgi:homoserine dehydrogenase
VSPPTEIGVALLGLGNVGQGTYRILEDHGRDIARRLGAPVRVIRALVRDGRRVRPVPAPLVTTDVREVLSDPRVSIVVEVMGGLEPARTLLEQAIAAGKQVVTANKALLAEHGDALFKSALDAGVDLHFEAAVCGGIPIIRTLRESLASDRIQAVVGIVNGTTNFILDRMDSSGADFSESLEEAQALGYAEADPTADVEAFDAAAKAAILAGLAFHTRVTAADVHREGITEVTAADIASAKVLGRIVKLLAICEQTGDGVAVRVHPAMISRTHPLAAVGGAYNAVFVDAKSAGQLMFYGAGAGGTPTASAVLGDIVAVARNRLAGTRGPEVTTYAELPVLPMGDTLTRYHVSLDVADKPGVLAPVAEAFARHGVSIQAVRQTSRGTEALLVIVTHEARDADLAATISELKALPVVRAVASVMRVEGEEDQ